MNRSRLPIDNGPDFIAEFIFYPHRRRRHSTLEVISRRVAQFAYNLVNYDMAFCVEKRAVLGVDDRGRVAVIEALYPRVRFIAKTSTHPVSYLPVHGAPDHPSKRNRQQPFNPGS